MSHSCHSERNKSQQDLTLIPFKQKA